MLELIVFWKSYNYQMCEQKGSFEYPDLSF